MRNRGLLQHRRVIALALSLAMLISMTGCKKEDSAPTEQSLVVVDANDAITKLAEAEADYGYQNALSELTEKSVSTIDGDSYYRLQQNYQGIPVYGRTVVCATDDSGHITSITGNPVDINLNIDSTPSITSNQVQDSISSYVADILGYAFAESVNIGELSENDLCFYTMSESEEVNLAYCVAFGGYEFIVDAATGEVLLAVATIQDATVPGYKASDTEMDNPFNVEKYSETEYVLEDNENNIIVMDLNGIPSTENNDTVWNLNKANRVVSTDNIFGNDPVTESAHEDGATLLQTFTKMHEFFSVKLEVNKQSETGTFVLYYRDGYQNGKNARGGCDDENNGILLMGSEFGMTDLDVIAHEYTHIITRANVNWTNATIENYALNEAYSDIFGELVEAWYNNQAKPNWRIDADFISRILRDVQTPSATGNAVSAEGIPDELGLTKDEIRSYGYEYSTVISRAAYLMWNGIDGTDSKRISTDELAELWYRAMLMIPSDCSFSDCRQLVELAATSMEFTTAQIECVSEAFDAVGITGTTKESFNALYDLALNSTLSVYGGDGELYDNYTLNIAGNTTIYGPVIEKVDSSYNRTTTITRAEPYELNLPQGIYVFTITDNANPSATSEFTVCVQNNDGDANIDIFTNFGCTPVKGTVSEIKEVNGVDTNVPVTNAIVNVYSHAQESVVETIDMSETEGFFEVYLPIGNYSVTAEAEGYISSTTSFELTSEEAEYLELILEPDIDLVTDAYSDAIVDGEWTYCYHIPQVNLSGNRGEAINTKMYDKFHKLLSSDVYQSIEEYDYPYLSQMVYTWGQKDNLLSIVMQTDQTMYAWTDFYVYAISVETGEELSYIELLAAYDLSETDFYDLVKETLKKYWDSRKSDMISFVGEDYYNTLVARTIAEENVKDAIPYINANGELCFVAYIYSPAGGEGYYHLLNTTGTVDEGWIECTWDHFAEGTESDSVEPEQAESMPEINSDTITEQELLGEWVIDTEYTMEFNDMSMWDFYGTSFSDGGNKMTFGFDGSYKYYVAWCYGNGTFELQNDEISVNLTDGDPIQGAIKLFVTNDGVTRIALDQYGNGNLIFWIKS